MSKQTLVMRHLGSYAGFGVGRVTQIGLVCENTGDQVAKLEVSGTLEFEAVVESHDPYYAPAALTTAVTATLEGYEAVADAFDDLGAPEVYVEVED